MTDGTMIRSRPRTRETDTDELGDRRPGALAARAAAAARVVGAATAVSLTVAGMFALWGPGQTVRGLDPRAVAAAAAAERPVAGTEAAADVTGPLATAPTRDAEPAKPAEPAEPVKVAKPKPRPAAVALPSAKNLTPAARRTALVTYLERTGVPLAAAPAKIVQAARDSCTALSSGTPADDFAADLARAAGYTSAQSTQFLKGATHFYCPRFTRAVAG